MVGRSAGADRYYKARENPSLLEIGLLRLVAGCDWICWDRYLLELAARTGGLPCLGWR